jgi:putative transposase
LQPLIPLAKPGGRPRDVARRAVLTTLLYLHRTGGHWDLLPHDLLPQSPVDAYVSPWRHEGTWPHRMAALRADGRTQPAPSPAPTPSAASSESPSVQTTDPGGERGDDGGKNSNGRQRHGGVDTLGLLVAVVVTSAASDDAGAAPKVLAPWGHAFYPRWAGVWGDRTDHHHGLNQGMATASPGTWHGEMVRRPQGAQGFVLVPKRWVVERTVAWRGRCRRHRRDYERPTASREALLRVSAIHLRRTRLEPSHVYPPCRYRLAA